MRQAILITAYQDLAQLNRLLGYFDEDFEIFIHLDHRCKENTSILTKTKYVHIFQKYNIEWGATNHLRAILLLMREAYAMDNLQFFHLITGSDYPIVPLAHLKSFGEENANRNYVECFPLPHPDWGLEGGMERIRYYWIRPNAHRTQGAYLNRKLLAFQRKIGIHRKFDHFDEKLYGGSTYWSVSRKAVGMALEYIDANPGYLCRFCMTSIAEEICLPTLWAGLGLPMENNYKRFIDWGTGGWAPQTLTIDHWPAIKTSDALFARKMDSVASEDLLEKIDQELLKNA